MSKFPEISAGKSVACEAEKCLPGISGLFLVFVAHFAPPLEASRRAIRSEIQGIDFIFGPAVPAVVLIGELDATGKLAALFPIATTELWSREYPSPV